MAEDDVTLYTDLTKFVYEQAQARGVIVLIDDGVSGSGIGVYSDDKDFKRNLPEMLYQLADQLKLMRDAHDAGHIKIDANNSYTSH